MLNTRVHSEGISMSELSQALTEGRPTGSEGLHSSISLGKPRVPAGSCALEPQSSRVAALVLPVLMHHSPTKVGAHIQRKILGAIRV